MLLYLRILLVDREVRIFLCLSVAVVILSGQRECCPLLLGLADTLRVYPDGIPGYFIDAVTRFPFFVAQVAAHQYARNAVVT